eukprot:TRINITY_DN43578_c0_g1_i1.p1 TRINITY_DN43578_c0_g1~~TRINITY_DN43578_c0_g1_i1.p1  ORF type:complete len:252 (-),score=44.10 TRINITY_DN43578_c0_g1_i1:322-1077(-)
MQMATKSQTPGDYWDNISRFWDKPEAEAISKWLSNDASYLTMNLPPLGRHYSERWEEQAGGKHKHHGSASELKQPEGIDADLSTLEGYHGLNSLAMHHHTVAQRMMGALVQLPPGGRQKPPKQHPAEAQQDTVVHGQRMAKQAQSVDWNEVLCNELIYVGLLDIQDDTRLRVRDCEENVISQHFRAAQESLKAVRKRSTEMRTRAEMALNKDMPKIEHKNHVQECNKKLEREYSKGIRYGLAEWRAQSRMR